MDVAIRADGSMLLESRRELRFVPVAGPAVKQDLEFFERLAVYPDGLLATDWSVSDPKQFYPVYFIPFDGSRLRMDERVQVVGAGVKFFSREEGLPYQAEPYRFGNLLAWVEDSTLHTFDLTSHERKTLKLSRELNGSRVYAFDGASVICDYAFDATSGKLLREANP